VLVPSTFGAFQCARRPTTIPLGPQELRRPQSASDTAVSGGGADELSEGEGKGRGRRKQAYTDEDYSALAQQILEQYRFDNDETFITNFPPPTLLGEEEDRILLMGVGPSKIASQGLQYLHSPFGSTAGDGDDEESLLVPQQKGRRSLAGMSDDEITVYKREQNKVRARRSRLRRKKVESSLIQHTVDLSIYHALIAHSRVLMAALSVAATPSGKVETCFQRLGSNWEHIAGVRSPNILIEQGRSLHSVIHFSCATELDQVLHGLTRNIGCSQTISLWVWRFPASGLYAPPDQGLQAFVRIRCRLQLIPIPLFSDRYLLAMYCQVE